MKQDVISWLRELLADGPVSATEVREHAGEAGYAWRTVQRAMQRAGVESKRIGFGKAAAWALKGGTGAPVAPSTESGANDEDGTTDDSGDRGANGANGATDDQLCRGFTVSPVAPVGANDTAPVDDGWREAFEERAAILEYDAGMPRDDAERAARGGYLINRKHVSTY